MAAAPPPTAVIRVKRKATEDPVEALVLQTKRGRDASGGILPPATAEDARTSTGAAAQQRSGSWDWDTCGSDSILLEWSCSHRQSLARAYYDRTVVLTLPTRVGLLTQLNSPYASILQTNCDCDSTHSRGVAHTVKFTVCEHPPNELWLSRPRGVALARDQAVISGLMYLHTRTLAVLLRRVATIAAKTEIRSPPVQKALLVNPIYMFLSVCVCALLCARACVCV